MLTASQAFTWNVWGSSECQGLVWVKWKPFTSVSCFSSSSHTSTLFILHPFISTQSLSIRYPPLTLLCLSTPPSTFFFPIHILSCSLRVCFWGFVPHHYHLIFFSAIHIYHTLPCPPPTIRDIKPPLPSLQAPPPPCQGGFSLSFYLFSPGLANHLATLLVLVPWDTNASNTLYKVVGIMIGLQP